MGCRYPPEIIPVLVLGVPSMHVCGDFLGELLEHPALEKQVFAVQVLGSLGKRYAIPKMLGVARLVLGKGQDMCDSDSESRLMFFTPTLRSIANLCAAFPLLADNVIGLFLRVRTLLHPSRPLSASLFLFPLSALPLLRVHFM